MKNYKINTFLPIFQGFYGTIFECDNEENEIDDINQQREAKGFETITYDQCKWDYEDYRQTVAKECTSTIENELQSVVSKTLAIKFENLVSPKFYNFSNDSINIEISLNESDFDAIYKILRDNDKEFEMFIKNSYSSCDGFISSHSRYHTEWLEALKNKDNDLLSHKMGAILGFILDDVECYHATDLYGSIETHNVYASNYQDLIDNEIVE